MNDFGRRRSKSSQCREIRYPGYQRFFSRAAGIFGVAGHYKDLTETGNRARKVSGTQGRNTAASKIGNGIILLL